MGILPADDHHTRLAQIGCALSQAVTRRDVHDSDALRVLRHELRRLNTNQALKARWRSEGAQHVIDKHELAGTEIPKNSSDEALHCDHVFPLTVGDLHHLQTVDDWRTDLPRLTTVVCVTAAENYRLEQVERKGVAGWDKYPLAGVDLVDLEATATSDLASG
jgi:hypothetical protein